jgi:hypothetical protein
MAHHAADTGSCARARARPDVSDPVEIAATWGDLFFSGQVRSLDWLTTGTCEIDLGGTASDADPLDRERLWSYAQALSEAFDHVA